MLYFKFHQDRPINEEFDFWGGPNYFGGPRGGQRYLILKIRKSLIQNGGPNSHRKFLHSSSIRKLLKTDSTFFGRRSDFKNSKKPIQNGGSNPHPKNTFFKFN